MTIEEVTNLRKQEKDRTLRKPECMVDPKSVVENSLEKEKIIIANMICKLLLKKGTLQNFTYGSLVYRAIIKNSFTTKSFKGLGTQRRPYVLEGEFGKAEIYNAHEFFRKRKYPEHVEQGYCFGNCHTMAYNLAYHKIPVKILSGISNNYKYSVLHSVLEVRNKYILDFNLNLYIEKEMYSKLFPFEVLSELDGKRILEDKDFIMQNFDVIKDKSIMYFNFAYDDVLNYIKDKQRQQQNIEFEF